MTTIAELEKRARAWGEAHGYYQVANRDGTPGWIHDATGAIVAVDWLEFHSDHYSEIEHKPRSHRGFFMLCSTIRTPD